MRPSDYVQGDDQERVFWDAYKPKKLANRRPFTYQIGDTVRIAAERHIFLREHFQRWTDETFSVAKRWRQANINMYELKDCGGEQLIGSFYEPELSKVEGADQQIYRIERVLDEEV